MGVNPLLHSATEFEAWLRIDEGALKLSGLPHGVGGNTDLEVAYSRLQASSNRDGEALAP